MLTRKWEWRRRISEAEVLVDEVEGTSARSSVQAGREVWWKCISFSKCRFHGLPCFLHRRRICCYQREITCSCNLREGPNVGGNSWKFSVSSYGANHSVLVAQCKQLKIYKLSSINWYLERLRNEVELRLYQIVLVFWMYICQVSIPSGNKDVSRVRNTPCKATAVRPDTQQTLAITIYNSDGFISTHA